jgi:1,4-dihydroxy-2-naphthoate octaprenyltransferase
MSDHPQDHGPERSILDRLSQLLDRIGWLGIGAALLLNYVLGAGIARYLGARLDFATLGLGFGVILSLFLAVRYLDRAFDLQIGVETLGRQVFGFLPYRSALLLAGAIFAALTAALAVLLIARGVLSGPTFALLISSVILGFLYAVPPIRLSAAGFGELSIALLLANLTPAFAFNLQFGEFHRLLAMVTAPLTFFALAMFIILALPRYAQDIKYENHSLATRMGWEQALSTHNFLVIGGFAILAMAGLFELPNFILLPALLPLPLGIFQIFYLNRIANGIKPNWVGLRISAASLLGLSTYLLAFAFWTH